MALARWTLVSAGLLAHDCGAGLPAALARLTTPAHPDGEAKPPGQIRLCKQLPKQWALGSGASAAYLRHHPTSTGGVAFDGCGFQPRRWPDAAARRPHPSHL